MSHFIDTHCHLDHTDFALDLDELVARALNEGVGQLIIPAAAPKDLPRAQEIAHRFECIYFASGTHPDEISEFNVELLKTFTDDPKCVAIGECGLDYFRLEGSEVEIEQIKSAQKKAFIEQIKLAIELDLPLIVHIRDASEDAYEVLRAYKDTSLRGVLHCFNADEILLDLANQFYFGIGGVCTFKNAKKLQEILPHIPQNRLIFETDAPYLTPHPHRGTRNEPSYIPLIASKCAELLDIPLEILKAKTAYNAKELFRI